MNLLAHLHKKLPAWVMIFAGGVAGLAMHAEAQTEPVSVPWVKLWPTAVVTGDTVLLGDLAELGAFDSAQYARLRELALTSAPPPGGSRIVPLTVVRQALRDAGVNMAAVIVKGAAECAVRRPENPPPSASTPIVSSAGNGKASALPAPRTLRDAVQAYFDTQLAEYGGHADLRFGRKAEPMLSLASPPFTFHVQRQSGSIPGLARLTVQLQRPGEPAQEVELVVNVTLLRQVVTAQAPINQGATIRSSDVSLTPQRFTRLGDLGLTDPGEVVGLRAKRFLRPGEALSARDCERIPLVRRGQFVEVYARVGAITVKTAAKAGGDGGYGESIALHLQGRRREQLRGRIIGPRRVLLDDTATQMALAREALR